MFTPYYAGMAELADAQASGACGGNIVWVQVPFPAVKKDRFGAVLFSLLFQFSGYKLRLLS